MGYMDANGDAEGNYTLIGLEDGDGTLGKAIGLYPVGTLYRKQHNDSVLPVCIYLFFKPKV